MAEFRFDTDIASRTLQHLGQERIPSSYTSLATAAAAVSGNRGASEVNFLYDKRRLFELSRNLWVFATRRAILRALDNGVELETSAATASGTTLSFSDTSDLAKNQRVMGVNIAAGTTISSITENTSVTLSTAVSGAVASGATIVFGSATSLWTPPTYAAATTYSLGSIVKDSSGYWWQSKVASNTGNTPGAGANWERYFGTDTVTLWDTDISYFAGEIVSSLAGNYYVSLISGNESHDPTTTTNFWLLLNGTAVAFNPFYPLGTGPSSDNSTSNIYRLPHGFLRMAPENPRAGVHNYVGFQGAEDPKDWVLESEYLVSSQNSALFIRYVADVDDVALMHPLFCELLAADMALMLCEQFTQDQTKKNQLRGDYRQIARDARGVNAVEVGPITPYKNKYLLVR